eukprot:1637138-Rhodomonas_salina.6
MCGAAIANQRARRGTEIANGRCASLRAATTSRLIRAGTPDQLRVAHREAYARRRVGAATRRHTCAHSVRHTSVCIEIVARRRMPCASTFISVCHSVLANAQLGTDLGHVAEQSSAGDGGGV